jgi:hypothetical protein
LPAALAELDGTLPCTIGWSSCLFLFNFLLQGTPLVDRLLLAQLLEAADLAYAAYKVNPQSACAVSHLRVRRACDLQQIR